MTEEEKFRQAEKQYHELRSRLDNGEISVSDLKQALKKLMIVDPEGRYWMIGGKTGRWYRHDGSQWIQDDPFPPGAEESPPVISLEPSVREVESSQWEKSPIREEAASPLETESPRVDRQSTEPVPETLVRQDTANCRVCDAVIPADAEYCPACGANQNETAPPRPRSKRAKPLPGETVTLQVRSIRPFSLLFLMGGLGLILGVVIGASFGIFQIFGDLIYQFPRMLQETRGKIQGGLIFGVLGGILGFLSFSTASLAVSGLYNILADLFGGLRMRVRF